MALTQRTRWAIGLLAGAMATLSFRVGAAAQGGSASGGPSEATTALHYLELSSQDSDSAAARKDLQRAINCLVGSADTRYSAAAGNPCQSAGRGAIPDAMDGSVRQLLRFAVGEAENALKEADLTSLQADALAAMDYLHSADIDGPSAQPGRGAAQAPR